MIKRHKESELKDYHWGIVEDNLGMGGAFIHIEQRDENGKIPEDGLASWIDYDDADEYYQLLGDND